MTRHSFQPASYEFDFDANNDCVEQLFNKLRRLPGRLLLDGATAVDSDLNRYTYVAADPIYQFVVGSNDSFQFDQLRQIWNKLNSQTLPPAPAFQGGLAGYFAYELNAKLQQVAPAKIDEFATPLIVMNVYDVVVSLDRVRSKGWIISQGWSPESLECSSNDTGRELRAQSRLEQFRDLLFAPNRADVKPESVSYNDALEAISPESEMNRVDGTVELYSDLSRPAFLKMIQTAVDYIHAGDIFQTNLSQRLLTPATCASDELYLQMRRYNPAPFSSYFDFGEGQIISASPERLVSLTEGEIETRPIKGTRKRTGFPEVDLNVSHELEHCEKDRAENVMIVDLMRSDLSKVAEDDSVVVSKLCGIERYEKVLHLVSVVEARLKADCDCIDLLEAVFPGGSITGAPKIRAMEIIAELEPTVRGPYCGSLGYINHDGNLDFNIMIRTITAKAGWWQIPVGGGIVSDSDPQSEYDETWTKAAGMLKAVSKRSIKRIHDIQSAPTS